MLTSVCDSISSNPELDLYPEEMREAIDAVNAWVYPKLNNGVYRSGFATTQEACESGASPCMQSGRQSMSARPCQLEGTPLAVTRASLADDEAVAEVFEALDGMEEILSRQRWLAGDGKRFTEADLRAFVTIVRFDAVYVVSRCSICCHEECPDRPLACHHHNDCPSLSASIPHSLPFWTPQTHFKCNRKTIREYANITDFMREIYQMPGISDTVDLDHIRHHYQRSHPTINKYGIVAVCPDPMLDAPHDRARFPQA